MKNEYVDTFSAGTLLKHYTICMYYISLEDWELRISRPVFMCIKHLIFNPRPACVARVNGTWFEKS